MVGENKKRKGSLVEAQCRNVHAQLSTWGSCVAGYHHESSREGCNHVDELISTGAKLEQDCQKMGRQDGAQLGRVHEGLFAFSENFACSACHDAKHVVGPG